MSEIKLLCDSRERQSTLPLFPKSDILIERTLTVGDYAIVNTATNTTYYLFERKTWVDLAGSIKDGRMHKQLRNMLDVKCMRYIILEGQMSYDRDTLICGIAFHKLDAMRRKMMMLGFYFIQTRSSQHTVDFLMAFTNQFIRDIVEDKDIKKIYSYNSENESVISENENNKSSNNSDISENGNNNVNSNNSDNNSNNDNDEFDFKIGAVDSTDKLIKRREYTIEERCQIIWGQFPGIGPTMQPIISKYSIIDIAKMSTNILADMKNENGRRFGVARAEKIAKLFTVLNNRNAINIIAEFPGISRKSAIFINKTITFKKFITEDMSDIMKSEKKKIGCKAAETIKKIVVLKL